MVSNVKPNNLIATQAQLYFGKRCQTLNFRPKCDFKLKKHSSWLGQALTKVHRNPWATGAIDSREQLKRCIFSWIAIVRFYTAFPTTTTNVTEMSVNTIQYSKTNMPESLYSKLSHRVCESKSASVNHLLFF